MKFFLKLALVMAALVTANAGVWADQPQIVPGVILVKYKTNVSNNAKQSIANKHGSRIIAGSNAVGVDKVSAPKGREISHCRAFSSDANVEFAEPDYIASPSDTYPTDAYFASQSSLTRIKAPAAWDVTTGSSTVTIAVIDTGVDYNHPDLAARMVTGYDFQANDTNPMDEYGHGTKVAGVVGAIANNSTGVAGITWNCKIMPLKVSDATGYSPYSCIANALIYAADHGARVATISIGGSSPSSTLQSAVNYAVGKGCVVVASAGNDSAASICYPAACDNVVAVGATDSNDLRISYSNYGPALDMSGPGYAYTTTKGGGYGGFSGTSAAAPHVSGVAALVVSQTPAMSVSQVVEHLEQTADDINIAGWDQYTGYGRVNAFGAVSTVYVATLDAIAPSVSITSPTAGANLSSSVSVFMSASDNVGISRIELFRDGVYVGQANSSNYVVWDTKTVADGAYALTAVAYDTAGNNAQSKAVSVNVSNSYSVTQVFSSSTSVKPRVHSFQNTSQAVITAQMNWSGSAVINLKVTDSVGNTVYSGAFQNGSTLNLGVCSAGTYRFSVSSATSKVKYTLKVTATGN